MAILSTLPPMRRCSTPASSCWLLTLIRACGQTDWQSAKQQSTCLSAQHPLITTARRKSEPWNCRTMDLPGSALWEIYLVLHSTWSWTPTAINNDHNEGADCTSIVNIIPNNNSPAYGFTCSCSCSWNQQRLRGSQHLQHHLILWKLRPPTFDHLFRAACNVSLAMSTWG